MSKRTEPSMRAQIRRELMHQREQMQKERYNREFESIYSGNLCPICHRRHMTGILCRMHRGNVCGNHCLACEYFEPRFHHCMFKETEPIDMRKWKLIYGCNKKEDLWRGIYSREMLLQDPETSHLPSPLPDKEGKAALERANAAVAARSSPKYIIEEKPRENGDFNIIDADTGEIQPFIAKHLENIRIWAAVEYLPPGA